MMVSKYNKKYSFLIIILFFIYLLCLNYITLFSRSPSLQRIIVYNPFRAYRLWFNGSGVRGKAIIQNFLLFVPYGYYVSILLAPKKAPFFKAILTGFALSFLIETQQYYSGRGTADVGDLLNNTIGASLGYVVYLIIEWMKKRTSKQPVQIIVATGFVFSIIFGCFQMYWKVGNLTPDVSQFAFTISSVDNTDGLTFLGSCKTFSFPTPKYKLYLRNGIKTKLAEINVEGDSFTGKVNVPIDGKYEILVKFQGFSRISTSTFINHGSIEYVKGNVPNLPEDPRLDGATLKAFSTTYDTYIFEKNDYLIWLIGFDIDSDTEIVCLIDTNEKEKLPEDRKQYGFDNLGFRTTDNNEELSIGHYRVFQKKLPEIYNITGVKTGFNDRGRMIWVQAFRVETAKGE